MSVVGVGGFQLLSITAIVCLAFWFCQFLWSRRKLYREAAKVHGPRGRIPILGSSLDFLGGSEKIYRTVMTIYNTYPDLTNIWYGPNLVWGISKPEYLETVMNHRGALQKMKYFKYVRPLFGLGLLTADVPKWKKHRKLILPAFNQKSLNSFVDVFNEEFEILAKHLQKYVNGPEFDIFSELGKCTLDIVCRTALDMNVDEHKNKSDLHKELDRVMEISMVRMFTIWYHLDVIFNVTPSYRIMCKILKDFHSFTDAVIKNKRSEYENNTEASIDDGLTNKRKVFLDLLIETTKLTNVEIRDEVKTYIIGGTDTTASTSSFLFIIFGIFPEIQEKVYAEIMEVIGPDRAIDPQDLPLLKYTERVIKETQRFFPIGAFIARDITEDIPLSNGVTLPEGSSVILGIMHVHKNPTYWPEPMKFDPDRFLPEISSKRHPFAYIPFSRGPRGCPGNRYAMMAIKSAVAIMIRKYKFTTSYKNIEDIELKANVMLRPIHGYKVAITERF